MFYKLTKLIALLCGIVAIGFGVYVITQHFIQEGLFACGVGVVMFVCLFIIEMGENKRKVLRSFKVLMGGVNLDAEIVFIKNDVILIYNGYTSLRKTTVIGQDETLTLIVTTKKHQYGVVCQNKIHYKTIVAEIKKLKA